MKNRSENEFTKREREIAIIRADGLNSAQVGEKLFISKHTVRVHSQNMMMKLSNIYGKTGVAIMTRHCIRQGWITAIFLLALPLCAQTSHTVVFVSGTTDSVVGSVTYPADAACAGTLFQGHATIDAAKDFIARCVKIVEVQTVTTETDIPLGPLFAANMGHYAALTWDASLSPNVIEYDIERSADGSNFVAVATLPRDCVSSHNDLLPSTEFAPGDLVYYRAKARDDQGEESIYSNVAAATVPTNE